MMLRNAGLPHCGEHRLFVLCTLGPLSPMGELAVCSWPPGLTIGLRSPLRNSPDDAAVSNTAASDPHSTAIRTKKPLFGNMGQMAGQ